MHISIFKSVEEAPNATGIAVVIDVFRAFSTEAYIFNNGATYIIPVQTLEEAYELKEKHPDYILIGERKGLKPEGFDYGNSPTEIQDISFHGKVVVHTTSNGTKGLLLSTQADEVLTGSFVNADAIASYIKKIGAQIISFVSTSPNINEQNEDIALADYIKDILEGKIQTKEEITHLLKSTSAFRLLFDEIGVPESDFDLCLDINKFNFIIRQETQDGKKILKRYDI